MARELLPEFLTTVLRCSKDDWHMHHHGSRYPHGWASDKNRVEEYWTQREPRQARFRKRLYEREGQVRRHQLQIPLNTIAAVVINSCHNSCHNSCCIGIYYNKQLLQQLL